MTSSAADDERTAASHELVAAWCDLDRERALHAADALLATAASAARALVVELLGDAGGARDLYNACAMHGFLIGKDGGSATFASATIDGLHRALGGGEAPWLPSARAAVLEGYVAARLDVAGEEAKRRWEYPRCAVRLVDKGVVALVAGFPDGDGEELADWAARVARAAVADGTRRARIAGPPVATAALSEALTLAGVAISLAPVQGATATPTGAARPSAARTTPARSWLPWRRGD